MPVTNKCVDLLVRPGSPPALTKYDRDVRGSQAAQPAQPYCRFNNFFPLYSSFSAGNPAQDERIQCQCLDHQKNYQVFRKLQFYR